MVGAHLGFSIPMIRLNHLMRFVTTSPSQFPFSKSRSSSDFRSTLPFGLTLRKVCWTNRSMTCNTFISTICTPQQTTYRKARPQWPFSKWFSLWDSPKKVILLIQAFGKESKPKRYQDATFLHGDDDVVREMLFFLLLFTQRPLENKGIMDSMPMPWWKKPFKESW